MGNHQPKLKKPKRKKGHHDPVDAIQPGDSSSIVGPSSAGNATINASATGTSSQSNQLRPQGMPASSSTAPTVLTQTGASSSSVGPSSATNASPTGTFSAQPSNNNADNDQVQSQAMPPSSSTGPAVLNQTSKKSLKDLYNDIRTTAQEVDKDNVDEYLDALIQRIAELLELIKGNESSKAKGVKHGLPISSSTFFKLKESLGSGIDAVKDFFKDDGNKIARDILYGVGSAHLALTGLTVFLNTLEIFETRSANTEECQRLMKEIYRLAQLVREFNYWSQLNKGMENAVKEATELIVQGSIMCCTISSSSFWSTTGNKDKLAKFNKQLDDMYRDISFQISIMDSMKAPLSELYPKHAVGIDEPISEIIRLLEVESEENALAVILYGFGGIGKSTLAEAVCSKIDIKGYRYSHVVLSEENPQASDHIERLQKKILEDLMGTTRIPEISSPQNGGGQLQKKLQNVQAFIFIDNISGANQLRELLPKNMNEAKKLRLLLTTRDMDSCNPCGIKKKKFHTMKSLPDAQAMRLLNQVVSNAGEQQLDPNKLNEITKLCSGVPILLELVGGFLGGVSGEKEKEKAFRILQEDRDKLKSTPFHNLEHYVFAFDNLPEPCKEPFLDICFYFKGWSWNTVEDILGSELDTLKKRALVTEGKNGVVCVHDVIYRLGCQKAENTRFKFPTVQKFQEEGEIRDVKGIWFTENKDIFHGPAIELDSTYKSLRILKLENSIKLDGKCMKPFKKLIFFQGAVSNVSFDVSECNELKYLIYQLTDLDLDLELHEMLPPGLKHVDFDGTSLSHEFTISYRDLQQLSNLRILRLRNFEKLRSLPAEIGDVLNDLQELTISNCNSIEELPQSISNLQKLKVLRLIYCSSLMGLPKEFASLTSLEEINLEGCTNLKELPRGFEKLSSLKVLNLSSCKGLSKLPHRLGYLASLANLSFNKCDGLRRIPESIGRLQLFPLSMDMSCCSSLRELPSLFVQLRYLTEVNLSECRNLQMLPQGFGQLIYLVKLNLSKCSGLKQLSHDFHCLSSMKVLDLSGCERLEELPQNFHCLPSLHHLYLYSCNKIEGKWMDSLVKLKAIQIIIIEGSSLLVNRWGAINKERNQSWHFAVYAGEDLTEKEKDKILQTLLSEMDCLLIDKEGNPFCISDLREDTVSLVMFHSDPDDDFPWPLIEETIDDIPIGSSFHMIYVGKHFNKLPIKVKNRISGYSLEISEVGSMVNDFLLTLDVKDRESWNQESWLTRYNAEKPTYFEMKMGKVVALVGKFCQIVRWRSLC